MDKLKRTDSIFLQPGEKPKGYYSYLASILDPMTGLLDPDRV